MYRNLYGTQNIYRHGCSNYTEFLNYKDEMMKYNSQATCSDVRTGEMRCNIEESHTIFCRHVDHKCWYEAKTKPALTTTGIIGSTFPVVTAT